MGGNNGGTLSGAIVCYSDSPSSNGVCEGDDGQVDTGVCSKGDLFFILLSPAPLGQVQHPAVSQRLGAHPAGSAIR